VTQPPDAILERLSKLFPKGIDLSLGRVRRLMRSLGDPQDRLAPVIHVAGTNGKGSTIAYLRAMLEAGGARVHVYTSPHLVRFNERIRVAGRIIDDAELGAFLSEAERANDGAPITYFEITTAAAFLAFVRHPADFVLLETGLGGRLDATNLVERPAATVLTPVAIDHTDFLGPTLAAIAGEKAGIMKPGAPAVIGPQPPEVDQVFAHRAEAVGAPLSRFGTEWRVEGVPGGFRYHGRRDFDLPQPGLAGAHQIINAGAAVATLETVAPEIAETAIRRGLAEVEWPARLQRLTRGPLAALPPWGTTLHLDGGHNEHAAEALADWARAGATPVDVVVGMRTTKAHEAFIARLAPAIRALRAVAIPGDPVSLPPERIAAAARAAGVADAAPAADVGAAITELGRKQPAPGRILVCGSLYLAGKVLEENG
jgi:dihydrofolate synthase/folylpolyglutamate synthase